MRTLMLTVVLLAASLAFAVWLRATPAPASPARSGARPHVTAASQIAAGRYLVKLQGCNDCHTTGWDESGGTLPEQKWLSGSLVGFRGPWGTTYAFNLRNYFARISVDQWLKDAHEMKSLPPMPWMSVRAMSDDDLRSLYAFIHSLGPTQGVKVHNLKPGEEPTGPYIDMTPQNLPKK